MMHFRVEEKNVAKKREARFEVKQNTEICESNLML